ncbi:trypsin-like serine peptidase [Acuticoccus sediminis]|uniref:trypsin-like serine peptidase n=1 Tax=Acuticoccus sediminis TaxID=2184697 RepID=UPI001CFEBDFC|nr:serine protease [Acuticoccus sediminis]
MHTLIAATARVRTAIRLARAGIAASAFLAIFLATPDPSAAQVAVYPSGTIYDLDPSPRGSAAPAGSDSITPVRKLHERDVLRITARAVGRLAVQREAGGIAYCTASVVATDLVLTSRQCAADAVAGLLWMGYLTPGERSGVASYHVELPALETSEALDYAILRVHGNVGEDWGTVPLHPERLEDRPPLFAVHYPAGAEQSVTLDGCGLADTPAGDGTLRHTCATAAGSSGAPLFDLTTRMMVGLHTEAVEDGGTGRSLAAIVAASPTLTTLLSAGATPREDTATAAPVAAASPGGNQRDTLAAKTWESLSSSTSVRVLEFFAAQYRDTEYAALAEARIAELQRAGGAAAPSPDDSGPGTAAQDIAAAGTEAAGTEAAVALSAPGGSQSSGRDPALGQVAEASEASSDAAAPDTIAITAADGETSGLQVASVAEAGVTELAAAQATATPAAAAESSPDAVPGGSETAATGAFNGWNTYKITDATVGDTCYTLAAPERKRPVWAPHGGVWFFVTNRASTGTRQVPTFTLGIDLKADVPVTATVDARTFAMTSRGVHAFVADPGESQALAAAMRAGETLTIDATTAEGITWHYAFPLTDIAAAMDWVDGACP